MARNEPPDAKEVQQCIFSTFDLQSLTVLTDNPPRPPGMLYKHIVQKRKRAEQRGGGGARATLAAWSRTEDKRGAVLAQRFLSSNSIFVATWRTSYQSGEWGSEGRSAPEITLVNSQKTGTLGVCEMLFTDCTHIVDDINSITPPEPYSAKQELVFILKGAVVTPGRFCLVSQKEYHK